MKLEEFDYNPDADIETAFFRFALFAGDNVDNITIQGRGLIDGAPFRRAGPKPLALKTCQHITIRDITIQNAPNYNISLMDCDYSVIDNVTILNGLADGSILITVVSGWSRNVILMLLMMESA